MLPINAAVVSRWPTSMSQLVASRLRTQSRKLRACRLVGALPLDARGWICGFEPVRVAALQRAIHRRAGGELVRRQVVGDDLIAVGQE